MLKLKPVQRKQFYALQSAFGSYNFRNEAAFALFPELTEDDLKALGWLIEDVEPGTGWWRLVHVVEELSMKEEDQWDPELDIAIRKRHLRYYAQLIHDAQTPGDSDIDYHQILVDDINNIRLALSYSSYLGDYVTGLNMVIDFAKFWLIESIPKEGYGWTTAILEMESDKEQEVDETVLLLKAKALYICAELAFHSAMYDETKMCCEKSLLFFQMLGEKKDIPVVYNLMGQTEKALNNIENAISYHMQAKEAYLQLHDSWGLALSYFNLGVLKLLQGKPRQAIKLHEEALTHRRIAPDDTEGIAASLLQLGIISFYSFHDYAATLRYHSECLQLTTELNDRATMAKCYSILGLTKQKYRVYPEALNFHQKALELAAELADKQLVVECLENFAMLGAPTKQDWSVMLFGFCKAYRTRENLGDVMVVYLPEHLMAIQLLKPHPEFHTLWAKGAQLATLRDALKMAFAVTEENLVVPEPPKKK